MIPQVLLYTGIHGYLVAAQNDDASKAKDTVYWPANRDAPHCGCQITYDLTMPENDDYQYADRTCQIQFHYGRDMTDKKPPHFVSIASAFAVGRGDTERDVFKFTGIPKLSNDKGLHILVFYDEMECINADSLLPETDIHLVDDYELLAHYYNLTDTQTKNLCSHTISCNDEAPKGTNNEDGIFVGNFNYEVQQNRQTYSVPIFGLAPGDSTTITLYDYGNERLNCNNPQSHNGHGTADGCTDEFTCRHSIQVHHDEKHKGMLQYITFEPTSADTTPQCFDDEDEELKYQWKTPSPWDTKIGEN